VNNLHIITYKNYTTN